MTPSDGERSEFMDRMLAALGITREMYDEFAGTPAGQSYLAAQQEAAEEHAAYVNGARTISAEVSEQLTREMLAEGKLPLGTRIEFDDDPT